MTKWTTADQALFETIAKMTQPALYRSMRKYLKKYYGQDGVNATKEYILCEGNLPVMLVAHMDTVFKTPPQRIFYDVKQTTMWSPEGLGADDRAGVYLIWRIVQSGYLPHICLTTDEELGCVGAGALIKDFPNCPFGGLKYIIELDRQGTNDCVFYSCANEQFQTFVESYGFLTDWGTYSDISDICPAWKVAGVNLSVGYKGEHQTTEILNTHAMLDTLRKVKEMLKECTSADVPKFEFVMDPYDRYFYSIGRHYLYPYDDEDEMEFARYYPNYNHTCQCARCGHVYQDIDVFPVKAKDFDGIRYYCLDCVDTGINWCKKCGEPFEVEKETDEFCPDCLGKQRPKVMINNRG